MLGGCGSSSSEKATESNSKEAPAAERTLKSFYDAANDADCERACAYLTAQGIRQIVRVGSRAACVRTIDGFSKGSFAHGDGELVDVEHVEDRGDTVEVEAEVKSRSGGTYRMVKRDGELLVDSFESEEK